MAAEAEEASLCNDVPEDDIAVLAAGGEDGAGRAEAEGGGGGAMPVERRFACTGLRVPQPDAPIGVSTRNLNQVNRNEANSKRGKQQKRREFNARGRGQWYRGGGGGGGCEAGDGEGGGGGGGSETEGGKAALEIPGCEAVEGGGEEEAAGGVVGDVGLRGGDHAEGERRLVAEVGLHHGPRPAAALGAERVVGVRVYGGR